MLLPGDGLAEWVGVRDVCTVPFAKNPDDGYVVAANADPSGGAFDGDPSTEVLTGGSSACLACFFDIGVRHVRIQDRIASFSCPLGLEDAGTVQGDVRCDLAARLLPAHSRR